MFTVQKKKNVWGNSGTGGRYLYILYFYVEL